MRAERPIKATNKRRIAVVGLGMAAKPHFQSLRDLADRVEVAACHAPSAARRASFAAAYPGFPTTGDLDKVLADRSISAVLLLTPPFSHLDLILRCAAAGKHVLVEKPLEATLLRARQAVEAMERAKLRARRRAAAPLSQSVAAPRRPHRDRRARRAPFRLGLNPLVAPGRIFR